MQQFNIDAAFFSARGMSTDGYCVHNYELTALTAKHICDNSNKRVLLCTGDKFDANNPFKSVSLERIDCCITDLPVSEKIKNKFKTTSYIEAKRSTE